ncbi:MAG: ParB N-terminal domain-containing protein [Patescibacteria group bacterium]
MNNRICLIKINKLISHEMVSPRKLKQVRDDLMIKGYIKNPVVVDQENFIILDGHHRVAALKQIGADKIPVYLVDYQNKNIRVTLRRKEFVFDDIKQAVINYCLQGKIFPSKTTRHLIKNRPKNINFKIANLFNKHL